MHFYHAKKCKTMNKEQFIAAIEALREQDEKSNKLITTLETLFPETDMFGIVEYFYPLEKAIIKILKDEMDDESIIETYIYEADYGRENLNLTLDGVKMPFKTAEDLYNFLKIV